MRPDLILWLAAGLLLALTALLSAVGGRRGGSAADVSAVGHPPQAQTKAIVILGAAALAALLAGLGWRMVAAVGWLAATSADALALLAAGTLVIAAWSGRPRSRRGRSLELLGAGALALVAAGLAWYSAPFLPGPATRGWLFGVRGALIGLGLGGWLPALAADIVQGATEVPTRAAGWPALRLSFPWLTAAIFVGAVWSLAAHATPWRGVAAELWQVIAWLLGGIYLHAASGTWRPTRGTAWLAPVIAGCGLAVALLIAWQAPAWF